MGADTATGVTNGVPTDAAVTREALIAELEAGEDAPKAAATAEPAAEPDEDAAEPVEATDPDAEPLDDSDEDADSDLDDDEDALEAKDPETSKRLAAVRKQEQRAREAIAAERRQFERERAEYAEDIAAVREFKALRNRWKYDPVAVARALGASDDDFEVAARAFYANSSKGAADPKNKEAVERSMRERELQDRLDAVTKRLDEREKTEKQQAAEAAAAREVENYIETVAKAVTTKAPLAAHFLAKSPEKTRAKFASIAYDLSQKTGTLPSHRDVLRAYEKARAEELTELGIDPATITKKAAATAPKGAKPAAKPAVTADESKEPTRDELIRELEQLS